MKGCPATSSDAADFCKRLHAEDILVFLSVSSRLTRFRDYRGPESKFGMLGLSRKDSHASIRSADGVLRNTEATDDGRVYIACSGMVKVGVGEPAG